MRAAEDRGQYLKLQISPGRPESKRKSEGSFVSGARRSDKKIFGNDRLLQSLNSWLTLQLESKFSITLSDVRHSNFEVSQSVLAEFGTAKSRR